MVDLVLGPVGGASYAVPSELSVDGRRVRLRLVEAGLACCAVEVSAAISRAGHSPLEAPRTRPM